MECLISILESKVDEGRKFLLVNAVETYLDLAEPEAINYSELVASSSRGQEVESMKTTWADQIEQEARSRYLGEGLQKGRSEGLKKGRSEGFRMSLKLLLEKRFGPLDPAGLERFESMESLEDLERFGERLLKAKSLAELGLTP